MTAQLSVPQQSIEQPSIGAYSTPARVAGPDEGIGLDELQLATRNHGLPLETLRYDVTPTGLHYLLAHYDIPAVDPTTWRLDVCGAVRRAGALSLDNIRRRERVTRRVTMECAGNGRARLRPRPVGQPWLVEAVGTAEWTGTPLAPLLREADLPGYAVEVSFTGCDRGIERGIEQDYARGLPLAEALRPDVLLAYEMNGAPLPPQHGFPLRLVVPGWYGMASVKWLREIRVLAEPFTGFQNVSAYRFKQHAADPGTPVTRIRPRALMIPPGVPDYMSRIRFAATAAHLLEGRAWSGQAPVTRVEVSTDAGRTWADATLDPPDAPWAWRRWSHEWHPAEPGRYELVVRATDGTGEVQPTEQPWNLQGKANNMTQQITVIVRDGIAQ